MSDQTLYVTEGEIAKRMGVGIRAGRKAVQEMREHPRFPPKTIGGKRFWPSVVDFLNFWNGRTVNAPGISAGQETNHGQTEYRGRAWARLEAAKEGLRRDLDRIQKGIQAADPANRSVHEPTD